MNYWLTTHWPPYEDEPAHSVAAGVWIPEGRQAAGTDFAPGDFVFIYHPRSGRTLIEPLADGSTRNRRCQTGREGIVAIAKATDSIHAQPDSTPEKYTDGTETLWRWHAPLKLISTSGFVPSSEVLNALEYKSTYNFRGFGDYHSGLKKLTDCQFNILRDRFSTSVDLKSLDSKSPISGHTPEGGGESDAHRNLKEYVAANPSIVIGEPNVETVAVERSFPTGDRADIVLRDQFGSIIGLEIELDIPPHDITGPLQAIKYRRMLEMVSGVRHGDGRAILVAHTIPEDVRTICEQYEIECFVVNSADVQAWGAGSIAE
ncbi:hypothetical protein [uncultured Rubinisphaera sp.]|uniref:hypothetical protein n=1 Tax=uncultured Rubinisphaera sp. TaxID=1678686 RepID=UPI000ED4349D|nr:hypothetical protein [Planctomycetaceae bacterium]